MPCYDSRNEPSYIRDTEVEPLRQKNKKLEAMLCALIRGYLSNYKGTAKGFINNINEKESGCIYILRL